MMLKKLKIKPKHWFKQGQVALIVLLLMVVILTIGLSLASRTVTDLKISQDEKEALRAFSAAEAGIEDILSRATIPIGGPYNVIVDPDSNLSADVTIAAVGNGVTQTIEPGATMHVNLIGSTGSPLTIDWTAEDGATLQATVYRKDGTTTYSFRKCGYNNINPMPINNGFSDTGVHGDCTGSTSPNKIIINNITDKDQFVLIKPYYKTAEVTVYITGGDLAVQQYILTSIVSPTEGNKASQIEVTRSVAVLPPIFDYALFNHDGNLIME